MTPFEAWVQACNELNHSITLLATKTGMFGHTLSLYMVTKEIPFVQSFSCMPKPFFDKYYVIWHEKQEFKTFIHFSEAEAVFRSR